MPETRRTQGPGQWTETILLFTGIGLVVSVLAVVWVATHGAAALDGRPAPPVNPFEVAFGLIGGDVAWSSTASLLAAAAGAVLVLVVGVLVGLLVRTRKGRTRLDEAAPKMGRGKAVHPLTKGAMDKAERLGVTPAGLPIGTALATGKPLLQDWEAVSIDVLGPRAGKTSGRAIPAVMAAPGAVVATSNKRDLVDATRDPRERRGRVWVFDPQGVADEPQTWWWNPLSYVTDETRAQNLAQVLTHATRRADAKTDAYFDNAGVQLLGDMLLAAAVAGRPITQVYYWLSDPNDDEPVGLLDDAGYALAANALRGVISQPEKQRAGVYGTAQQTTSFLTNRQATRWVVPNDDGPEFRAADFATSNDALYLLSREGRGNAGPLVTALTVAVCEAAEEHAARQPRGRLAVPMVICLDEAANVCRWHELPNLASHYGSRGMNLLTFLQSWSQGVEAWGKEGMRKLWSACNVRVVGGGVSEVEFLEEVSRLVGEEQHKETSVSRSLKSGSSTSSSWRKERVLEVSELAAMEPGRAVVFGSGAEPTIARLDPWWDGDHAAAVRASVAAHDPAAAGAAS